MTEILADTFSVAIKEIDRELKLMEARVPKFLDRLQFEYSFASASMGWLNDKAADQVGTQPCYGLSNQTANIIACQKRTFDAQLIK
jgi:hypothetical protein